MAEVASEKEKKHDARPCADDVTKSNSNIMFSSIKSLFTRQKTNAAKLNPEARAAKKARIKEKSHTHTHHTAHATQL